MGRIGDMRLDAPKVSPRYVGGAFNRQTDETAYELRARSGVAMHDDVYTSQNVNI